MEVGRVPGRHVGLFASGETPEDSADGGPKQGKPDQGSADAGIEFSQKLVIRL